MSLNVGAEMSVSVRYGNEYTTLTFLEAFAEINYLPAHGWNEHGRHLLLGPVLHIYDLHHFYLIPLTGGLRT
jgi:hypothetical protein